MITLKKLTFACTLASGLLASSAFGADHSAALGDNGEVYQVKAGAYRDFFPKGSDAAAQDPVLALEIQQPGETAQRILVPYTKGSDIETSPAVLFEENFDTVYLVWAVRQANSWNSALMLASFEGGKWSRLTQVTGNRFATKSSPQLTITRDNFSAPGPDGQTASMSRTILHLTWVEEAGREDYEVLYSPVILVEGTYIGTNPIYSLSDVASSNLSGSPFAPPQDLVLSPTVHSGRDKRAFIVAFASAVERRVTTLEIDTLPEELSRIGDTARANIIEIGRVSYPADRPGMAEKVRQTLVSSGGAFQADVIRYIADQVYEKIVADRGQNEDDLQALGEVARANIIEIGASFSGRGLRDRGSVNKSRIAEVEHLDPKPQGNSPHLIRLSVVSSRPMPQVGAEGLRLFLSESGQEALFAWLGKEKDRVYYRMSQDDGWNVPREIKLS
ncbi:MAG TPA: hypothetical protein VIW92_09230, partial [Thermoanaerobaculia bacterium]